MPATSQILEYMKQKLRTPVPKYEKGCADQSVLVEYTAGFQRRR